MANYTFSDRLSVKKKMYLKEIIFLKKHFQNIAVQMKYLKICRTNVI